MKVKPETIQPGKNEAEFTIGRIPTGHILNFGRCPIVMFTGVQGGTRLKENELRG